MQIWSLSSGSSGNCYLLREGDSLLVVEAGLSALRVVREIEQLGLHHCGVAGVVVTHEHSDHVSSAMTLASRLKAPLYCSSGTRMGMEEGRRPVEWFPLKAGCSLPVGALCIEPFPLPHDAREPVGLVIRAEGAAVCLATDMGSPTEEMIEAASGADLVILEANHDPQMLARGPYPAKLKARIRGEHGHLSNLEAADSIVRMARGRPESFWLAHLSDTNNSPGVALSSVRGVLKREGLGNLRVEVAQRNRRSLHWDSASQLRQLALF